jgi:hypothetical protein
LAAVETAVILETTLRIEPMLEEAVAAEDARHEAGEGDAEGAELEVGFAEGAELGVGFGSLITPEPLRKRQRNEVCPYLEPPYCH